MLTGSFTASQHGRLTAEIILFQTETVAGDGLDYLCNRDLLMVQEAKSELTPILSHTSQVLDKFQSYPSNDWSVIWLLLLYILK